MRTIVWWTVWGLVVAIGVIGLLDMPRNHYYLLVSLPLLTGAFAAAVIRMQYEYHHAIEHAKWVGISCLFLLGSVGFFYVKAHAFGPFATGSAHKAFLGTTFEMSIPEVERTLGRKFGEGGVQKALQEQAQEWILDALPLPLHKSEEHYAVPLMLYDVPSQAIFHFDQRKLSRVEILFEPPDAKARAEVSRRVQEELAKEYQPAGETPNTTVPQARYKKDAVDATVLTPEPEHNRYNLTVVLQYLPLAVQAPPPVAVQANAF